MKITCVIKIVIVPIIIILLITQSIVSIIRSENEPSELRYQLLWRDKAPIRCIAIGDVDSTNHGQEIICGGDSKQILMISRYGRTWKTTTLATMEGPIYFIGIGDINPLHPGDEIAFASGSNCGQCIYILEQYDDNWMLRYVPGTCGYGALWGFRVGDYNTTNPGDEICLCWENPMDFADVHIHGFNGITWSDTQIYVGNMVVMDAPVGEFNASHPGNEIIMFDEDGDYFQLVQNGNKWETNMIWDPPMDWAGREAEIGDIDPDHPGNEILVRTRYIPYLVLLSEDSNIWTTNILFNSTDIVADIAIADITHIHNGNEIIAAVNKQIILIWKDPYNQHQQWISCTHWISPSPITCFTPGDFDLYSPGIELVVADEENAIGKLI
ncbi:MAG: hypothetical protein QXS02_06420 [Candidatus Thermoplasmatota archaeon]